MYKGQGCAGVVGLSQNGPGGDGRRGHGERLGARGAQRRLRLGGVEAGALGIIGPVRLDYAKFIPYIEYFSDSVSKLLTEVVEPDHYKEEREIGGEKQAE